MGWALEGRDSTGLGTLMQVLGRFYLSKKENLFLERHYGTTVSQPTVTSSFLTALHLTTSM